MKIKVKLNVKVSVSLRQLLAASWVAAKLSLLISHYTNLLPDQFEPAILHIWRDPKAI